MKLLKSAAIRAVALLLFFAIIAAVILYQAGVYDIVFIERPAPPVTEESGAESVSDAESGVPEATDAPETRPPFTDPPVSDVIPETRPPASLDGILSVSDAEALGYRFSTELFDGESIVARLAYDFGEAASVFSLRTEKITSTVFYEKENGLLGTKKVTEEVDKPRVSLYFGFILVDNGKTLDIYNGNGEKLVSKFSGTLTGALSKNGKPVVTIKKKYYELDHQSGLSSAIAQGQVNFKALTFDHPLYYAETGKLDLIPFSEYVDVYVETILETVTETETEAPVTETDGLYESGAPAVTETDPVLTEPAATDAATEPVVTEPLVTDAATEPVATEPIATDAVTVSYEPAMLNGQAENAAALTDAPSAEPPVTDGVLTDAPASEPPVTELPDETAETEETPSVVLPEGVVEIDGKYYTVETKLMYGYRDSFDEVIIEPQFASVLPFSPNGLACVTDFEGSVFYIDTKGKEVVTLRNEVFIRPPDMSYVRVRQFYFEPLTNGVESLGAYYFDSGYTMVRYCRVGSFDVRKIHLSEFRLVDTKGDLFDIPGGYSLVNYSDGVLLLEKDGRYGYMDTDGAWVSPAVYQEAAPFLQGLAAARNEEGKWGLLDRDGNEILPFAFDSLSSVSGGRVAAFSAERGWEIYCVMET